MIEIALVIILICFFVMLLSHESRFKSAEKRIALLESERQDYAEKVFGDILTEE